MASFGLAFAAPTAAIFCSFIPPPISARSSSGFSRIGTPIPEFTRFGVSFIPPTAAPAAKRPTPRMAAAPRSFEPNRPANHDMIIIHSQEIMSNAPDLTQPLLQVAVSPEPSPSHSEEEGDDAGTEASSSIAVLKAFKFSDINAIIQDSFNDEEGNLSTICDIMAMYLKGQKILYTEAKTVCEQRLNALMLPAIFITSACAILSLVLKDFSYGTTIVSSLNGVNAFILALISYMKLDAKAEAHRMSAYKFDKLQSILTFNSGKMLFIEESKKDIAEIIKTTEKNVREIKETNQFILPEIVRFKYPQLYSINIFAEVKKLHNREMSYINDIKDIMNELKMLYDKPNKTDLEHARINAMETVHKQKVANIISLKNQYLEIDDKFEVEMKKNRESMWPDICGCLKS